MNPTRDSYEVTARTITITSNEEMVVDERCECTSADLIQQKLQRLLPSSAIPVSCLHAGRQLRRPPVQP